MLAGIGLSITLAQLHVVLGGRPGASPWQNAAALPAQVAALQPAALAVGAVTIVLVVAWPRLAGPLRRVPGPLVAVVAATALALAWPQVPRVDLPGGLLDAIALPVLPEGQWPALAGGMLTVALIASVKSLLSAVAVDRVHTGPRTQVDRELVGQGAANSVSGMLGGLPVTGVIVRSSANVAAGARTRLSTVLHGVWIAVFALLLAGVVEMIPLGVASLVGCGILTGYGAVVNKARVTPGSSERSGSTKPGSASRNSFGTSLVRSHCPYRDTMSRTRGGTFSIGICRGHSSVGQRSSRDRNGAR